MAGSSSESDGDDRNVAHLPFVQALKAAKPLRDVTWPILESSN